MTYGLGIITENGLVLASDSRSNAGVDRISSVQKMALFTVPGDRVIALLSAGNLGTTQAVVSSLRQAAGTGNMERDLHAINTMYDAAQIIGSMLREVLSRDADFVRPWGDPNASFILGGQLRNEPLRLFEVYSAGNFVEASPRTSFLQIGESKYGKPILDRALTYQTPVTVAAKLALISFDATIRSNLTVAPPIDMLCYTRDSFSADQFHTFTETGGYLDELRAAFAGGLSDLIGRLPAPPMFNA